MRHAQTLPPGPLDPLPPPPGPNSPTNLQWDLDIRWTDGGVAQLVMR